jgi:dihydroxy-acid dehydratase
VKRAQSTNADVIKPYRSPMKKKAGFKVLKGNLFDSAIMKTSVISDEFRKRYLSNRKDKDAFEAVRWSSTGRRTITTASMIHP